MYLHEFVLHSEIFKNSFCLKFGLENHLKSKIDNSFLNHSTHNDETWKRQNKCFVFFTYQRIFAVLIHTDLCMIVWSPVYSSCFQISVFLFKVRTKYLCLLSKAFCCTLVFPKTFVQWLLSLFKKRNVKVVSVDKGNTQVMHLHRVPERWF